jgi:hypothetical protein
MRSIGHRCVADPCDSRITLVRFEFCTKVTEYS